jgi:rhamnogalacturonyl hydrolase YesR
MTIIVRSIFLGIAICLLFGGCQTVPGGGKPVVAATQPALVAQYPIPYGPPTVEGVTDILDRVRVSLDTRMVMRVTDPVSGEALRYPAAHELPTLSGEQSFGLTGYPAGVIYAAMLSAADATGEKAFADFDARRFQYFADTVPKFTGTDLPLKKNPFHDWVKPDSLDSCGAMGAAFVKARRAGVGPDLKILIDRFADFVSHGEYRLDDGTLARHRPFRSCLWLDDMYMSIPILSQMGALTGDQRYYDDAAKQVIQISARLFNPATGLYTHGCDMDVPDAQPSYCWGRANGWAIMAMCETLDVLPENHPQRAAILKLLRAHAKALASLQSGQGLWHQMLDRPDTVLETSCSAMFTYAIAHAVDRGWLNEEIYGPVAIAGWNGLTTRIDSQGHVTGICVATSYAADYVYYYSRPMADDEHGYGPVIMAGAEIIRLLKNPKYSFQPDKSRPVLLIEKGRNPTMMATQP